MKRRIKITLLAFAAILLMSGMTFGQRANYRTAIGVRWGWGPSVTVKHFFNERTAFEGMVNGWPYGIAITGLAEFHHPFGLPGLQFYYGVGGHMRFYQSYYRTIVYEPWPYWGQERIYIYNEGVGFGVDGIIGLEYKIPPIPLAISFDFKPFVEFNTDDYWMAVPEFGLGLKVAF